MKTLKILSALFISSLAGTALAMTAQEAADLGPCYKQSGHQAQTECYDIFYKNKDSKFAKKYKAYREREKSGLVHVTKDQRGTLHFAESIIIEHSKNPETGSGSGGESQSSEAIPPEVVPPNPVTALAAKTAELLAGTGHANAQSVLSIQQEAIAEFFKLYKAQGKTLTAAQRVELLKTGYLHVAMERTVHGKTPITRDPLLPQVQSKAHEAVQALLDQGISATDLARTLKEKMESEEGKNAGVSERYLNLLMLDELDTELAGKDQDYADFRRSIRKSLAIDVTNLPALEKTAERKVAQGQNPDPNSRYNDASYFLDADQLEVPGQSFQSPIAGPAFTAEEKRHMGPRQTGIMVRYETADFWDDADQLNGIAR